MRTGNYAFQLPLNIKPVKAFYCNMYSHLLHIISFKCLFLKLSINNFIKYVEQLK